MTEIEQIKKILTERGWYCEQSPPLPEYITNLIDLLESLQKSQTELRVKLYNLGHGD